MKRTLEESRALFQSKVQLGVDLGIGEITVPEVLAVVMALLIRKGFTTEHELLELLTRYREITK